MCRSQTSGRSLVEWAEHPITYKAINLSVEMYNGEECFVVRLYDNDECYEGRSNNFSDAWIKAKNNHHEVTYRKRLQNYELTPIGQLDKRMRKAASELNFDEAARLRDEIRCFFD